VVGESQEIVKDQHLAVGVGPSPDPNRRISRASVTRVPTMLARLLTPRRRHPRLAAGSRPLVSHSAAFAGLRLDFESPEGEHALGRQAEVAHDGNLGIEQVPARRRGGHGPPSSFTLCAPERISARAIAHAVSMPT